MPLVPQIDRYRHETRRRKLTIAAIERITPNMLRMRLTGDDLAGFTSLSPADHVKLFVPDGAGGTAMRDYTPRHFDGRELWLDFALHDAGPATLWALAAKPGDIAEIGGPRGSMVIGGPIAHWVLVGDETALPSIGRRIAELPAGSAVTSLVAVPGPQDEQVLRTAARHRAVWVHRQDPTDPEPLLGALATIDLPPAGFIWIAAEAGVARALRDHCLARGHAPEWMKAAGYWLAGQADGGTSDL